MTVASVPGKATTAQKAYLSEAVKKAYDAGWGGSLREKTAPRIARWASRPTRVSLRSKGLLEFVDSARGESSLTKHGVEVGEVFYKEQVGESAKARAGRHSRQRQEAAQARQDRKDKIAHLFRGLHLHREAGYRNGGKKYRTVAAHLEQSSTIQMNEEDLLALGEGIEKLRK